MITTALIPGRPAPRLIPASAVEAMRPGSVIVDLAAEAGGNCELTTPGEITVEHDVTIVGLTNLPSTMPYHASQLYSRNVIALCSCSSRTASSSSTGRTRSSAGACVAGKQEVRRMSAQLVTELTILMLAIFLGFEVISKVPTLLHTPLMSGTNAIHGIVIVGAIIVAGQPHPACS